MMSLKQQVILKEQKKEEILTGDIKAFGRNVTTRGFDVTGDPLNKRGAVFCLEICHVLVNLPHRHLAAQHARNCNISCIS